ncbi:hypothetical protein [Paenarthrobacter sp. C1]|uniref:hypothetical protein n=1 Tax=Paenarthrobacter sp. C1 TaxID=3400220 RepID=UPI003BF500D9
MTMERNHSDDHPGCRALWPWLPACNRYRLNVNLIAAATDHVRGMPEVERADWLDFLRGWEGRSKWHLRSEFIAHRENWRELDQQINLAEAASLAGMAGEDYLQGRTVEQAAADTWKLKVQRLALEVLYVYKAPVPDYVADSLIPR